MWQAGETVRLVGGLDDQRNSGHRLGSVIPGFRQSGGPILDRVDRLRHRRHIFYFLPPVYRAPGFWSCVGLFMIASILKAVFVPRLVNVSNDSKSSGNGR